jgi:dTDP-4-amino-4,6-dideoxygalactose transaminase
VKQRNKLYQHLIEKGIQAKIHYPIPLHLQKAAEVLGYKKGDFPVCEDHCCSIITLPVHQHLTEDEIDYVIDQVRAFYTKQ